jgi:hypothetical protein
MVRGRICDCSDIYINDPICNCNKKYDKYDPSDKLKHKFMNRYEGFSNINDIKNYKIIFLIIITIFLIYLLSKNKNII